MPVCGRSVIGQNVNAYHGPDLMAHHRPRKITGARASAGILRLRTTSHPCDMHDDLIAAHTDLQH